MKLLPLTLVCLALGAALGVALGHRDVGTVETSFAPPPRPGDEVAATDGAGPAKAARRLPQAAVDAATHDFGVMQRGSSRSHEFVFTNEGEAPLSLRVGRTSCKCTLGDVADQPLAPGESCPVRLEWVARTQPGAFRQTATVLTNDPRQPSVELTVEGRVAEVAGLEPKELLFGRLSTDERRTESVYLTSFLTQDEPLVATARMSDGTPDAELYDVRVESASADDLPIAGAKSGVRVSVTAGPGLPVGTVTAWVEVETNLTRADENGEPIPGADPISLQVPLLAVVEGDVSVHGAGWSKELGVLNLGSIRSAKGRESKLRLSFKGDGAAGARASVDSVEPEWLQVDLGEPREVRPGVVHQPMTVRVPPGRNAVVRSGPGEENGGQGEGDARVRLVTTHPSVAELDVRVRFVIAE
ncbi:MAG: DUF1573 domain-containing protein [Planctomycetota bacterium]